MYDYTFFHGNALIHLIQDKRTYGVELLYGNHCYLINKKSALYLKHCTKRISPWQFTFLPEHLTEISRIETKYKCLFVALICNDDGICCLNSHEISQLVLVGNFNLTKSIRVARLTHEKYTVTGSDGRLPYKIGNSDFPRKIFEE